MSSMDLSQLAEPTNPWTNQGTNLTGLRLALVLGEQTGHIANASASEDETIDYETDDRLPSMKLIKVLKKMSKAREELDKMNLEIQCRMQDKETRDITHLDILEKRIEKIKKLNGHLESVIESKDQLIKRLQQPYQGEYLKLEAQYHRFACELFPQITALLGDLSTNLENIIWVKSLAFNNGRLDALMSNLSNTLSAIQTSFLSYKQIQESISQLHTMQTGPLNSTHM